jgi:hypothetical protein
MSQGSIIAQLVKKTSYFCGSWMCINNIIVFFDATMYGLVDRYQCFGGACCIYFIVEVYY